MTAMKVRLTLSIIVSCFVFRSVFAQTSTNLPAFNWTNQTINFGSLDLSVPQSPAFTALGLTPQSVVRPTTPQQLALSLLNGADQNGNLQSGIAVDTAPYFLFEGNQLTINDYRDSYWQRFLARSTVSFATTKGANANDSSVRLATGLRLTIFDFGDPRLDTNTDNLFDQAAGNFRAPPPNPDGSPPDFSKDPFNATAIQHIQQAAALANWNRSSFVIGAAPSWIDKGGGNFVWNGASVYSSFAYGFEQFPSILRTNAQLTLGVQYFNDQQVATNNAANGFYTQNSLTCASDLRIGVPDFNGTIEGAFVHAWPYGGRQESFARVAVSLEKKIYSGVWLEFSIGKDIGARNEPNVSLLGSLKFGWSSSPTMQ